LDRSTRDVDREISISIGASSSWNFEVSSARAMKFTDKKVAKRYKPSPDETLRSIIAESSISRNQRRDVLIPDRNPRIRRIEEHQMGFAPPRWALRTKKTSGGNLLTLKSGRAFRYYGNPTRSSGGTDFLVNKKLEGKIVNIRTISDDVRNILYKRPLQHGDNTAYVSATEHDDREMEDLYGQIDIARRENKYLMGDFNAKIGKQKQRSENSAWMAATRERY